MGAAGAPARMAPTRTPQLGSQDPRRSGWTGRWRWVLRCCPDQLAGPPLGRPPSTRWRRVTAQRRRAELTRFPGPNSFRACLPRLADDLLRGVPSSLHRSPPARRGDRYLIPGKQSQGLGQLVGTGVGTGITQPYNKLAHAW